MPAFHLAGLPEGSELAFYLFSSFLALTTPSKGLWKASSIMLPEGNRFSADFSAFISGNTCT